MKTQNNINEVEKTPEYMKGFLDGFEKGYENNRYKNDAKRYAYDIGYEAGVSYYCQVEHPEDENV
jgi:hypothetical protein